MSFGNELQDIQAVNNYLLNDLAFIQDFRDMVKERMMIEKDYIHKLENLQKKYSQKSEKRGLTLSVGSVKLPNGDTVIPNSSTYQNVYDKFLKKFDESLKDRNNYVEKLNTLTKNIKSSVDKKEEIRKRHMDYSTRINSEVSNVSSETDKNEVRFREACNNTDTIKKKIEKNEVGSNDDKNEKSKKLLDQSIIDMNNKKNIYVLSIKVSNAYNEKLTNVENKNILDNMQALHESIVEYYKSICNEYLENENDLCQTIESCNDEVVESNNQINIPSDIALYIQYNKKEWKQPEVKTFAPIPLWETQDNIYKNDNNAVTFLRNTSLKLQQNLSTVKDDIVAKNKELDGLNNVYQSYKATPSFGDPDEIYQKIIDTKKEIAVLQLEELKCEVQINAITEAIGSDEMLVVPHNFKSKNFIKQTVCSFCNESLWRKGLSCKECNYVCHIKCELNVPPNCTKQKLPKSKRSNSTSVSNPSSERSSTYIASSITTSNLPTSSSMMQSPRSPMKSGKNPFDDDDDDSDANPFSSSSDLNINLPVMVAAYDYTKQIDDEVDLHAGEEVTVIENDKGDGWIKVSCSSGTGLVPANYLEPVNNTNNATSNYTTTTNYRTSFLNNIKKAKVIYDYTGQMDEELTVTQDDIVTFIENSEPGWIKVKNEKNGNIGLIPESYVEYIST
ncbi:hypothetical protein BCR32DRAFT_291272 [Anaeromyces robustus]|uniref:FCH-domain-containing protein n=1 Tax=Anaeromyces robustus TaxID=1754192 RepID=A0A1Y1XFM9_9FUNG|nr:hypothetical protein BCR32DRAFT_291272 [Anaeromyces robustus]|eukprot:ORX84555.1 hypothetical protein BCR32DRAFT_291272 [Anaeromyces robustus]